MAPRAPITHLLYLHGFRSSPQSMKAQKVGERLRGRHPQVRWWCPQLPPSPAAAAELILRGTADWPAASRGVIGSSLGGFYARWYAVRTGARAVLINPASQPARDLAAHIGEQTTWQNPQERFFFEPGYVDELRALEAEIVDVAPRRPCTPQNTFALLAKGDEVLDWREMQAFCAGADIRLLEGGDHAISDFDDHIDAVFAALGLV